MNNSHSQTSFMSDSLIQTPTKQSSPVQVPSICSSHFRTSPKGNSHNQTHIEGNFDMLTFSTANPQAQNLLVDDPHDRSQLADDPHDQSCLIDKSNYKMNNHEMHASQPGNSQDQHTSVSESPDHTSVSDSQNPVPSVGDADNVQTYKNGILQLRALRLEFGKDSPWSRRQGKLNNHRRQRRSTTSGELKSIANVARGNSLEEISHLVKNCRKSRFLKDNVMCSTSDSYTPSLNQDRKYPVLASSRHKCDISKRLHEEDSRKQAETFFPKELHVNTRNSSTHPIATVEFTKTGHSDRYLAARKDQKRITDKKYCYQTVLNTTGRICEGRDSDGIKLLPRLRFSGLPHQADGSSCKTDGNSVLLKGNNRLLHAASDKWGSTYGNFSSKCTTWERWIGNTLAVQQTSVGNPCDYSLFKGNFRRVTEGFTPGDGHFLPGQLKLSDSGTNSDADPRWHRPRRDPPASPTDLEEVLSPVTRVIITTTERHW